MARFRTVNESRAVWLGNKHCAYCGALLPGRYGTPGVAMSRADNTTPICSACGTREALADAGLAEFAEYDRRKAS